MDNQADNLDFAAEYIQAKTDAAISNQVSAFRQSSARPSRPDCIDCGEEIPQERQAAVAGVQHCVPCAHRIDIQSKGVRRG